ncbi:MAG: 3-oxoacyl-[acyl-carrier-protein] reductase [Candidatus Omnitrophica bacterium]|nr:3-oxoacyl-[acyl-carrier-protein] reductase [Candidatus Omnitrophota bacterium]
MLKDKVAIVTGSAQGIGREIALRFAEEGAKLALCDLNEEALSKTASEIGSKTSQCIKLRADVTNPDDVEAVVKKTLDTYTKIDILVNNAGITKDNLLVRLSPEDWDLVLSINLRGTFLFTKAVSRPMMKQRSGTIINISSIIGIMGNAGQANYAASKAGVIGLTKSVAKELASRNIRANAIAPGFIKTAMTDKIPEEMRNEMLKLIPLGRLGEPKHVADLAVFLASELADYVTGQVIQVDGGMVM